MDRTKFNAAQPIVSKINDLEAIKKNLTFNLNGISLEVNHPEKPGYLTISIGVHLISRSSLNTIKEAILLTVKNELVNLNNQLEDI